MARVYTKPNFNLTARVWFHALPDDLTLWDGEVPTSPPNVTFACQLYFPRWGLYRWLHALSDSCFRSLLSAGVQELRYDLAVDLQAPWGVSTVSRWSDVPLCEVPVGSGRLYAVGLQEAKHLGFVNQYAVAILAQLGAIPPGPPPPPPSFRQLASGSALRAITNVTPSTPDLASGGALSAVIVLPPLAARLPSGSAMSASVVAGYAIASGSAMSAIGSMGAYAARLPSGSAMSATGSSPTSIAARLPSGAAETDQELFPSRKASTATGDAIAGTKTPPAAANNLPEGNAITATVGDLVKKNPCSTVGVPRRILVACTAQTGTLTGWTGLSCILTYNSATNDWTGSFTKSGTTGTLSIVSTSTGRITFSGSGGATWAISNLGTDIISCGPPLSGSTSALTTTDSGPTSGTTTWSVQPA